jgi:hypothetical protein
VKDIVLVVTPSRNAAAFIDETILSVVQQRGEFEIHCHVQDGGSTDATIPIVESWAARLQAAGGRFHGGAVVHMSWATGADRSMYDAIQTGFDTLRSQIGPLAGRRVLMTWINSDDVFTSGAFCTAASFLSEDDGRRWVTGIPSTITKDGTISDVRDAPYAYSRHHLASGRYDGRSRPFFQQEGTFWTVELWDAVGGLNGDLTLAGDWDLWRRMALHADVVTLRAVLAHHRRHSGQLTSSMGRYWSEVDRVSVELGTATRDLPGDPDIGLLGRWDAQAASWVSYPVRLGRSQEIGHASDSRGVTVDFSRADTPSPVLHITGLSPTESWGRWSDETLAPSVRITFVHPLPDGALIRLRLAVAHPACNPVTLSVGSQRFDVAATGEPRDVLLRVESADPPDTIDIRAASSVCPKDLGWSDDRRRLGIALYTLDVAVESQTPVR